VAEPDNEILKINPSEVGPLIEKIWQNKLGEQDKTDGRSPRGERPNFPSHFHHAIVIST
jgi:hypothetical protein